MKVKGIGKIISLGSDELSEYELTKNHYGSKPPHEAKVKADVFIYSYEIGSYDGSGVAVWRKDGEWAYQYLGHCSCNGPTEDIETSDKMKFTLEQVKEILLSKDNSWNEHYKRVAKYLNKYKS